MLQAFRTLIVGLMVASVLAACGGPANTGTASTVAGTTSPAASAGVSTAAMASTEAATMGTAETATGASTAATTATETTGSTVELQEVDPASVNGDIITAGSSTVFPLSQRMAERFRDEGFGGNVTVDSIGSGGGFERFCESGEIDIANASRAIKPEETESCGKLSPARTPIEFRVGTDALVVAVSAENTFLNELTMEQLQQVFSTATTWNEIDPSYPNEPIQRFIPGTDSGTFDFFAEAVFSEQYKEKKDTAYAQLLNAKNVQSSEDDNVLVQGVEGSPNAIGFFGFAYYKENQERLKAIAIDGNEPNEETAESGEYELARPLFIYSDAEIMKTKPQVAAFINFYLTNVNDEIDDVGYFPASAEALNAAKQSWLDAQGQ